MNKNFNVLITGIDGFSGSALKIFFDKIKINYFGISRKYKNKKIIKWDLVKKKNKKINYKINWIIHTAAIHKILDFEKNSRDNKIKNIKMTKNLIEFAKKNQIRNFIFFSTIDLSYNNISGKKQNYNLSKLKSESLLLKAYKKKIFKKVIILRVPAILGKKANDNFIINTIKKLENNHNIFINDRSKYNNFVHINDLCNLILKILVFCRKKNIEKTYFVEFIDCLSSSYIYISKKINELKKKLNSKSKILFVNEKKKFEFLIKKNNKFKFQFMSCSKAIKLILQN